MYIWRVYILPRVYIHRYVVYVSSVTDLGIETCTSLDCLLMYGACMQVVRWISKWMREIYMYVYMVRVYGACIYGACIYGECICGACM